MQCLLTIYGYSDERFEHCDCMLNGSNDITEIEKLKKRKGKPIKKKTKKKMMKTRYVCWFVSFVDEKIPQWHTM